MEEEVILSDFIDNNPSIIEEYFSDIDWSKFSKENVKEIPRAKSIELRKAVFSKVKKQPAMYSRLKVGIAALVILAIGISTVQWSLKKRSPEVAKVAPAENILTKYNFSSLIKKVWLPDSSYVLLSLNSKVRYLDDFDSDRRVVSLEGTAIFQVAKDENRPFIVRSSGISTTALGTRFKVIAPNGSNESSVILYEGKVVVSAEDVKDSCFYLLPGNSITYNRSKQTFNIGSSKSIASNLSVNSSSTMDAQQTADLSQIPEGINRNFQFENVPLEKVLLFLSEKFDEKIHYDKQQINRINFVGTIHKNDSLSRILEDIALINHLNLRKAASDSGYYLIH